MLKPNLKVLTYKILRSNFLIIPLYFASTWLMLSKGIKPEVPNVWGYGAIALFLLTLLIDMELRFLGELVKKVIRSRFIRWTSGIIWLLVFYFSHNSAASFIYQNVSYDIASYARSIYALQFIYATLTIIVWLPLGTMLFSFLIAPALAILCDKRYVSEERDDFSPATLIKFLPFAFMLLMISLYLLISILGLEQSNSLKGYKLSLVNHLDYTKVSFPSSECKNIPFGNVHKLKNGYVSVSIDLSQTGSGYLFELYKALEKHADYFSGTKYIFLTTKCVKNEPLHFVTPSLESFI